MSRLSNLLLRSIVGLSVIFGIGSFFLHTYYDCDKENTIESARSTNLEKLEIDGHRLGEVLGNFYGNSATFVCDDGKTYYSYLVSNETEATSDAKIVRIMQNFDSANINGKSTPNILYDNFELNNAENARKTLGEYIDHKKGVAAYIDKESNSELLIDSERLILSNNDYRTVGNLFPFESLFRGFSTNKEMPATAWALVAPTKFLSSIQFPVRYPARVWTLDFILLPIFLAIMITPLVLALLIKKKRLIFMALGLYALYPLVGVWAALVYYGLLKIYELPASDNPPVDKMHITTPLSTFGEGFAGKEQKQ